jgi:hypothetical protein
MSEWNPEQAPQAMVMNSKGNSVAVPPAAVTTLQPRKAGYSAVAPPKARPMAPAASAA